MFRILTVIITHIAILPKSTECVALSLSANNPSPNVVLNNSLLLHPDSNASLIDPTSSNAIRPYCTSQISWLGFDLPVPEIFINNCKTADEMLRADFSRYGGQKFDFLFRAYTPFPGLQVIRTPKKYTAGMSLLPNQYFPQIDQNNRHYMGVHNHRRKSECRASSLFATSAFRFAIPGIGCCELL